jgi:hypothetical protein
MSADNGHMMVYLLRGQKSNSTLIYEHHIIGVRFVVLLTDYVEKPIASVIFQEEIASFMMPLKDR